MHCEFACLLYNQHIKHKHPEAQVVQIISDATAIESEFVSDALPVKLIGMNAALMTQYIQFVADRLLLEVGCKKIYHVINPFDFMEMIALQGKTNFFEKRVGEYKKSGVMSSLSEDKDKARFRLDEEFLKIIGGS